MTAKHRRSAVLERQRPFVERILGGTGNGGGQFGRLLDWQAVGEQQFEDALAFAVVATGRRAGHHQHEFTALAV